MRRALLAWLLLSAVPASAQQSVDDAYRPKLEQATVAARAPAVAIDQGHRNFHTADGQFAPFARLITADGYRVASIKSDFSPATLAGTDILVIANARAAGAEAAAFSDAEIAALKAWVEGGGSLLLIADHAPFGTAAAALARAFGVEMGLGYVAARDGRSITSQLEFSGKRLGPHPILTGNGKGERVRRVMSFTGQSLTVPPGGSALLLLPDDALEVAGPEQIAQLRQGNAVPARKVRGLAQAVALTLGKGRVVVAGEAAMFTAQRVRLNGSDEAVGLTVADDQQFALNVMHWLSSDLQQVARRSETDTQPR